MAIKITKTKQRPTAQNAHSNTNSAQELPSLAWPFEHWLQFQAELFKATAPSLTGWIDRRCDGMTALLHSVEKLATCRELGDVMSIQTEWLDGVIKRVDLDTQALIEHATAVSQCTMGATRQAAQTTTEMTARGAEWIVHRGGAEATIDEPSESEDRPPRTLEAV